MAMKDLATRAVVTSPDGFYYRQEHEWRGMNNGPAIAALSEALAKSQTLAHDLGGKGGPLTAILSAIVDGAAVPDVVVHGITYEALTQFQRHAHRIEGDMISHGEHHAAGKHK